MSIPYNIDFGSLPTSVNIRNNIIQIAPTVIRPGESVNIRVPLIHRIPLPSVGATKGDWEHYFDAFDLMAARRNYMAEVLGMEEDVFGFWHAKHGFYSQKTMPTQPPGEQVAGVGDVEASAYPTPHGPSVDSGKKLGDEAQRQVAAFGRVFKTGKTVGNVPGKTNKQEKPTAGPRILKDNPELKEFEQALAKYQGLSSPSASADDDFSEPFQPCRQVADVKHGHVRIPAEKEPYLGDRTSKSFKKQQSDLPDELNCALFLRGLPGNVDVAKIFDHIHTGAVHILNINRPTISHATCAAKLVFMQAFQAANFLNQVHSNDGIVIDGYRINGKYNVHCYADHKYPQMSRVLQIKGPADIMNVAWWKKYFDRIVVYELGHVRRLESRRDGKVILEFGFARLDGQAEVVYVAINRDKSLEGVVRVRYAPDPCDPESGFH